MFFNILDFIDNILKDPLFSRLNLIFGFLSLFLSIISSLKNISAKSVDQAIEEQFKNKEKNNILFPIFIINSLIIIYLLIASNYHYIYYSFVFLFLIIILILITNIDNKVKLNFKDAKFSI